MRGLVAAGPKVGRDGVEGLQGELLGTLEAVPTGVVGAAEIEPIQLPLEADTGAGADIQCVNPPYRSRSILLSNFTFVHESVAIMPVLPGLSAFV